MLAEAIDGVPVCSVERPKNVDQLAECMAQIGREQRACVLFGSGGKMDWGNPSSAAELVRVELGSLRSMLEVQPDEGIVTVSAGISVDQLAQAAAENGMCTRLGVSTGLLGGTVGGTISADPASFEAAPGRWLRDDLLGLEVVLADGRRTRSGGRVVKNVTGFDLVRLYCGSFGSLGAIAEATLRLWPLPRATRVLRRSASDLAAACSIGAELLQAGVDPVGTLLRPDAHGFVLWWKVEGGEGEVTSRAARFGGDVATSDDWNALVADARRSAPLLARFSARPSDMLEIGQALGSSLRAAVPHSGHLWADLDEVRLPGLWERARASGWLLVLENASFDLRMRFDAFGPESPALPLMRSVKKRFDPHGRMAPGRFAGRL